MARPGRPSKVDRTDVINAAAKVFAAKGYFQSRLEDVADELNITKGAIYYHFPTKERLLNEVHAALMDRALILGQEAVSEPGPPDEHLRRLIHVHLRVMQEMPDHGTTWIQRWLHYSGTEWDVVRDLRERYEALWTQALYDCGVVNGDEPSLISKFVFGSLNWMHVWYHPNSAMSRTEMADYASKFILGGVAGALAETDEARASRTEFRA